MTLTYTYPGDPPTTVDLMFGKEFKDRFPNREIVVGPAMPGTFRPDPSLSTHTPVHEAICDSCNDLIADVDPCALSTNRLYCWRCFGEWIRPHLNPE